MDRSENDKKIKKIEETVSRYLCCDFKSTSKLKYKKDLKN